MADAAAQAAAAQAALDATAAAGALLANAAPAAVAPVTRFSLSPAHASDDVINYGTSDGMKLYNKATKPGFEYDGTADFLRLFLEVFKDHAAESNWGSNINIATANGPRELASRYGQITTNEL